MFVNYITYMLHIMSSFSISDPGLHKVYLVDFFFLIDWPLKCIFSHFSGNLCTQSCLQ